MDGPLRYYIGMSPTRIKTIGGTNTTTKTRHSPMGTTTIRM